MTASAKVPYLNGPLPPELYSKSKAGTSAPTVKSVVPVYRVTRRTVDPYALPPVLPKIPAIIDASEVPGTPTSSFTEGVTPIPILPAL